MASAQSRSDARGRPPPKRCVFTCTGSSGCNTAHNSSEMRNPVVVRLFGVRSRSRFLVACLFIPPMLSRYSDRHLVAPVLSSCKAPCKRTCKSTTLSRCAIMTTMPRSAIPDQDFLPSQYLALPHSSCSAIRNKAQQFFTWQRSAQCCFRPTR
jgi:hypothetical protein